MSDDYSDLVVGPYKEWQDALEVEYEATQPPLVEWYIKGGEPLSDVSVPQRTARSGEAALSGNTDPLTSHDSWQVSGGVDTLEVTCWGHYDGSYGVVEQQMHSAWLSAHSGKGNWRVEVMGTTLAMREKGFRWGQTFFHYSMEHDGIVYALRRSDSRGDFVARVQIGSLKLMRDGHRAAWAQAVRILRALGVVVGRTKVTRIDLCVDLPGVDVAPFVEAVLGRRCVTRSSARRYTQREDGGWGSVELGRRGAAGVFLRIYDKLDELKAHPEQTEMKRHVLIERRWGVMPKMATRGEFQIGGDWLCGHWADCSEVEEVFDKLAALMQYLTTQFFRITEGEVDRDNNHQSRAETASLWSETVVGAFKQWIDVEAVPLVKMEKKPVDRSRAGKRLVSAALSVAALTPGSVRSVQSLLQHTVNSIVRWLPPDEWVDKLQRKCDEQEASGARGVFSYEEVEGPEFGSYRVTVEELPKYDVGVHRTFVPSLAADEVPF